MYICICVYTSVLPSISIDGDRLAASTLCHICRSFVLSCPLDRFAALSFNCICRSFVLSCHLDCFVALLFKLALDRRCWATFERQVGTGPAVLGTFECQVGPGPAVLGTFERQVAPGPVVLCTFQRQAGPGPTVLGTFASQIGPGPTVLGTFERQVGPAPAKKIQFLHAARSYCIFRVLFVDFNRFSVFLHSLRTLESTAPASKNGGSALCAEVSSGLTVSGNF